MTDPKCARMLLRAAERDVGALRVMRHSDDISDEVLGFHAQQATEKSLKAWLALLGETYPLTHNLDTLLDLQHGDVLITIMGTVGRSCVFPGTPSPAICTKHVYRIQVNSAIHPEYLNATLRFSDAARTQIDAGITGQTVPGIKSDNLRRLQLSIPPVELQAQFADKKKRSTRFDVEPEEAGRRWRHSSPPLLTGRSPQISPLPGARPI